MSTLGPTLPPSWPAPVAPQPVVAAVTPPSPSTTPGRKATFVVAGATIVAVVVTFLVANSSGGGKPERFGSSVQSLSNIRTFTPESLNQALLTTAFPANVLPAGYTFDAQRSPNGKAYAARGFATEENAQRHHLVGTVAVGLTSPTAGHTAQITFLSFADPASAEAYMKEARAGTGATGGPGQPACGIVRAGALAGCSVSEQNVVVEGRDGTTDGHVMAGPEATTALDNVAKLAQAGVAHLRQIKG